MGVLRGRADTLLLMLAFIGCSLVDCTRTNGVETVVVLAVSLLKKTRTHSAIALSLHHNDFNISSPLDLVGRVRRDRDVTICSFSSFIRRLSCLSLIMLSNFI